MIEQTFKISLLFGGPKDKPQLPPGDYAGLSPGGREVAFCYLTCYEPILRTYHREHATQDAQLGYDPCPLGNSLVQKADKWTTYFTGRQNESRHIVDKEAKKGRGVGWWSRGGLGQPVGWGGMEGSSIQKLKQEKSLALLFLLQYPSFSPLRKAKSR